MTAISPGSGHTCAVVAGAVKCWGNNPNGVVGSVVLWQPVKVVSFDPLAVYLPMVQR